MWKINFSETDRLQNAIKAFPNNAEDAINDVLHNEAPPIIHPSIRELIPVSGAQWKGKKGAAKDSNSLTSTNGNLSVTIKTTKNYQYLYFPDDGTNTRRHVGNQQFFARGGEAATPDIIEKCISKITENFDKGV